MSVRESFDSVDNWSNMNTAGKKHPKSIWRDKNAAMAFLTSEPEQQEPRVGKELIYQQKYRPMYSKFITYSDRDLLQAPGTIAIGCPADLISYSAVTRYMLRAYGVEKLFRLRPSVTHVRRVQKPFTFAPNNDVILMFTRPSNKHPMYHESLHLCLAELVELLQKDRISTIHFPMVDTERPCNNLETWYRTLSDYFEGTGVQIVLHDRVYVSIASIKAHLPPELSDDLDPMEGPLPPPSPLKADYANTYCRRVAKEIPNPEYKQTLYRILIRRSGNTNRLPESPGTEAAPGDAAPSKNKQFELSRE